MPSCWTQAQPSDSHRVGVAIAAVGDELAPFLVGDLAAGELVRREEDAMARPLAVEREAVVARADLDDAFAAARASVSGSTAKQAGGGKLGISRLERVLGEGREDVGEEQLLVLLLVVDAELDQVERRRRKRRQRALQRLVDVRAIGADLVERRAAEHPAPGPRVARAFALVIAVEQEGAALVERAVVRRRDREARRSRRTRWCGRDAIWPATRRERAGSSRRRRDSGAARSSVSLRVANSRSPRCGVGSGRMRCELGVHFGFGTPG